MNDHGHISVPAGNASLLWKMPEELVQLARDAGTDIIAELLGIFQEESAARLRALRAAVELGDALAIRTQAHSLKGSAAQIGAIGIADPCRHLEVLSQNGGKGEQMALLRQAEENLARLQQGLSALTLEEMLAGEEIRG